MEIATVSYFNTKLPLEKRLSLLRDGGFGRISIWGEYPVGSGFLDEASCRMVGELAARHGLKVHSIHAPFAAANDLFSDDSALRDRQIGWYREGIRSCAELGAGILVVHAQRGNADMRGKEALGLSELLKLLPDLKRTGVKIALENMASGQSLEVLGNLFGELPEEFGFCYDSSHDFISPAPLAFIRRWGGRLLMTHLSDNRGVLDDHLLPWEGTIDWQAVIDTLPWESFSGPLMMESEMVASAVKDPAEFLAQVRERGEKLLGMRAG